jgi:hypothetical protein
MQELIISNERLKAQSSDKVSQMSRSESAVSVKFFFKEKKKIFFTKDFT